VTGTKLFYPVVALIPKHQRSIYSINRLNGRLKIGTDLKHVTS
jgi:hypothetical protein